MRKVYYNGIVYTGTGKRANYVIVDDNIITEAGYVENADELNSIDGEFMDLKGAMMLPGFMDSHAHPITSAFQRSQIVNDFFMSEDDVLDAVRDYIKDHPEKNSYFGVGHSETIFGKEGPKKEKLDAICKDKPIILVGCGGHDGWVNSKTLEVAGVGRDHPDPVPGFQFYRRNQNGEATGHLLESGPLSEVIEAVKPFELTEVKETLVKILEDYSSCGVTTIGDCGIICYAEDQGRIILDEFIEKDMLPQRIFGSNQITEKRHVEGWKEHLVALKAKYDSDKVRINTWKLVNDGTVESRSASMMQPFVGSRETIDPLLYGKAYYDLCVDVARSGFDLHLHAIGDRANHENLMAAKAVREAGFLDTRITNAHTQCVLDEDLSLFAKYNVIANTTGVWHYGDENARKTLGDRADKTFRMKTILDYGGMMSLGSDFPGDEYGIEPLNSIETGVTRQMLGDPDSLVLAPQEEKLSIEDMIIGFTKTPAYQFRMENRLGTIEAGKYADFTVIERNIFETSRYKIHEIPVMMTVMDGIVTYRRK